MATNVKCLFIIRAAIKNEELFSLCHLFFPSYSVLYRKQLCVCARTRVCVSVCVCGRESLRETANVVHSRGYNHRTTLRGTDGTHTPPSCHFQLDTRQVLDKPPFTVRDIVAKRRSYLGSTSCMNLRGHSFISHTL